MNSAHHRQLTSLIQAMFPGPMSQIGGRTGDKKKKKERMRGGLLIKVCLTLETISIKRQSSFPMQDLSVCVCSCFSAADSKIYTV